MLYVFICIGPERFYSQMASRVKRRRLYFLSSYTVVLISLVLARVFQVVFGMKEEEVESCWWRALCWDLLQKSESRPEGRGTVWSPTQLYTHHQLCIANSSHVVKARTLKNRKNKNILYSSFSLTVFIQHFIPLHSFYFLSFIFDNLNNNMMCVVLHFVIVLFVVSH